MDHIKKPELLSPAGDFEKLKAAVKFGADAVYLAGKSFGMRTASDNFTDEELDAAVKLCRESGVKLYVTVNVMPRDGEYDELERYLGYLDRIGVDALIISDIGVVSLAKRAAPHTDIHISTQASAVSAAACRAWHELGAKRIVLARELSLEDIASIRRALPPEVELETFIHGSMCIAYSGRCLLSEYLIGRDANRGACAQSCRWVYRPAGRITLEVEEEKRPGETIPICEEGGDTFVMSSRDLCMIEHVPELVGAGITSFKLEGRVRSAYYTAVVTNTYRMAIDSYFIDPENYSCLPEWKRELCSVSHRQYDTGFFFTPPHERANVVDEMGYIREKAYLATAVSASDGEGFASFVQRNKLKAGDPVELLTVGRPGIPFKADSLTDEDGAPIADTPHPGQIFRLKCPVPVSEGDILRGGDAPQKQ
ncbi:MAG: U32 family peptidase [Clostridia bacterium]|nr:U32 family peptidase [Clostridia bacterium]